MDKLAIRLQCLDLAVRTVGNPNTLLRAQEYFDFATQDEPAAEAPKVNTSKGKTK
jgi:hypothetical protein